MAAGAVTAADILEYDLDGNASTRADRSVVPERFIHSEIYRVRPDGAPSSTCHTASLIPFADSDVPLRAMYHTWPHSVADGVPVVRHQEGRRPDRLAGEGCRAWGALAKKSRSKTSCADAPATVPSSSPARSRNVVGRSIYLDVNAKAQAQAIALGGEITYVEADEAKLRMSDTGDTPRVGSVEAQGLRWRSAHGLRGRTGGGVSEEGLQLWEEGRLEDALLQIRRRARCRRANHSAPARLSWRVRRVSATLGRDAEAFEQYQISLTHALRQDLTEEGRRLPVARYSLGEQLLKMKQPQRALHVITLGVRLAGDQEWLLRVVEARALWDLERRSESEAIRGARRCSTRHLKQRRTISAGSASPRSSPSPASVAARRCASRRSVTSMRICQHSMPCWSDVRAAEVDLIVFGGDVVPGPMMRETLRAS